MTVEFKVRPTAKAWAKKNSNVNIIVGPKIVTLKNVEILREYPDREVPTMEVIIVGGQSILFRKADFIKVVMSE